MDTNLVLVEGHLPPAPAHGRPGHSPSRTLEALRSGGW